MEHIVKLTVYLIDSRYRENGLPNHRAMDARASTRSRLGSWSAALARPEWLVEMDAIAVISEPKETGE